MYHESFLHFISNGIFFRKTETPHATILVIRGLFLSQRRNKILIFIAVAATINVVIRVFLIAIIIRVISMPDLFTYVIILLVRLPPPYIVNHRNPQISITFCYCPKARRNSWIICTYSSRRDRRPVKMFDRSKLIPLSVRKLKDNDIHVEITKAKLLIKVSKKSICYQNHYHGKNRFSYYLNRTDHCTQNTMVRTYRLWYFPRYLHVNITSYVIGVWGWAVCSYPVGLEFLIIH